MRTCIYLFCIGVTLTSLQNQAKATLLSILQERGGTIIVGDKLFDQFTYSATGDMPDAFRVNVVGYTDPLSGDFGLKFQGEFRDLFEGGASDASLDFRVTVNDPNQLIDGGELQGNPAILPVGFTGIMQVYETFSPTDDFPNFLNIFSVKGSYPDYTKYVDSTTFPGDGYTSLPVHIHIQAYAFTGLPSLFTFETTFHQQTVPEPTSFTLFGAGLAMLIGYARFRRKTISKIGLPRLRSST